MHAQYTHTTRETDTRYCVNTDKRKHQPWNLENPKFVCVYFWNRLAPCASCQMQNTHQQYMLSIFHLFFQFVVNWTVVRLPLATNSPWTHRYSFTWLIFTHTKKRRDREKKHIFGLFLSGFELANSNFMSLLCSRHQSSKRRNKWNVLTAHQQRIILLHRISALSHLNL